MVRALDLADIQGNIVKPYGRFGFPIARHLFFNIANAVGGRRFVEQVRHTVTTAQRWAGVEDGADPTAPARPAVCVNIGFTWYGLLALALPTRTLRNFPDEFIDGMAKRWSILGDFDASGAAHWDPIWRDADKAPHQRVHVWISLSAQANDDGTPVAELGTRTEWLSDLATATEGVTLLSGHTGTNARYQDSSAIMEKLPDGTMQPTAKEHFGFTDGIGDPAFAGQYTPDEEAVEVVGGGKLGTGTRPWSALATGEFVLGFPSEAQELPPTAPPWSLLRNGTFMAWRKLEQDVDAFRQYIDAQAAMFLRLGGATGEVAARETVMAKMVGRWRNGIPLMAARTWEESESLAAQWQDIPAIQNKGPLRTEQEKARLLQYEMMLTNFRYAGDEQGLRCPLSAHIRRANPRDALDPTLGTKGATPDSALTNRRRFLRRGAPYQDAPAADRPGARGVIFMAICASLFRQFEFVQQQWIHYGASFNAGSDPDPLVGLHREGKKFVIPGDPRRGENPFICGNIPQFVSARGGEYFFLPSLTALREIAEGSVDPT